MFSTIQKRVSGVLSSLTASNEPPRLLQRPTSDALSLPNEPARSSTTARMPPSRSITSSTTDPKRQKGTKAAQFLIQNFDTVEDPIEVQFSRLIFLRTENNYVKDEKISDFGTLHRLHPLSHSCTVSSQTDALPVRRGMSLPPTHTGMMGIKSEQRKHDRRMEIF